MSIRVMLVDDHPVVRTGYARLLEQAGDIRVVGEADDTESAYARVPGLAPDVVVTDLSLPGQGGLELIRRLTARDPSLRILAFTMHENAVLVRRALENGARGFLTKSAPPNALVDAVREVFRSRPERRNGVRSSLPPASGEPHPFEALTAREFEVFQQLAQGRSPAECAALLNLSLKTVANYQTSLKEKLGVATTAALVHLAIRHGVIAPVAPAQG